MLIEIFQSQLSADFFDEVANCFVVILEGIVNFQNGCERSGMVASGRGREDPGGEGEAGVQPGGVCDPPGYFERQPDRS